MSKRFLISKRAISGTEALLEGAEAHHLLHVMRLSEGDAVELFDGEGGAYRGIIRQVLGKRVWVSLSTTVQGAPDSLRIFLLCAALRHGKMDAIIGQVTELGVSGIGVVTSDRSQPRWDLSQQKEKQARWRRIAQEACKQSGGNHLPEILGVFPFEEALRLRDKMVPGFFLSPRAARTLPQALTNPLKGPVYLLVGPEGGWSPREEAMAEEAGWQPVSLWERILKVDTACVAAVSIIQSLSQTSPFSRACSSVG